jgi:hypothetical protein
MKCNNSWNLLSKIFSSAGKFKEDFEAEILAQEDKG